MVPPFGWMRSAWELPRQACDRTLESSPHDNGVAKPDLGAEVSREWSNDEQLS